MESNNVKMTISDRLKELRDKKDITQKELADAVGLSRVTVGAYEKGSAVPQTDTLIKIAEKYNVSMDWLCGLDDNSGSGRFETYADVFKGLTDIWKEMPFNLRIFHDIYSNRGELHHALNEFREIAELRIKNTISEHLLDLWVDDTAKRLSSYPLRKYKQSDSKSKEGELLNGDGTKEG